jgi:hypothetical protein
MAEHEPASLAVFLVGLVFLLPSFFLTTAHELESASVLFFVGVDETIQALFYIFQTLFSFVIFKDCIICTIVAH